MSSHNLVLYTFDECKDILKCSSTKLYGLLRANRIEHYKSGGKYLISYEAIMNYLDTCREG